MQASDENNGGGLRPIVTKPAKGVDGWTGIANSGTKVRDWVQVGKDHVGRKTRQSHRAACGSHSWSGGCQNRRQKKGSSC
jgi:hypothetical protein